MVKPLYFTWCVLLAIITQHSPSLGKAADQLNLISIVTDDQGRFPTELKIYRQDLS